METIVINSYKLKEIQGILKNIHPSQIVDNVNILQNIDNLSLSVFKVMYEYTTVRNNLKEGEKYFLMPTINPETNMETVLKNWVYKYNKANKHRRISNVKFLDSQCLGYLNSAGAIN